MPQKFILNDETVLNSHGFYILNSGGVFDRFRENPVMLDAHDSDSCLSVIGRWGELEVSGPRLLCLPEFDTEDDVAKKISGKVERGFVKGASMGIFILDAEMREIPGKGLLPVVTKWELLEASPVPVPSNKASLRLYAADRKTILKADQLNLSLNQILQKQPDMGKINLSADAAKALGLPREPEESEFNAAIMELSARVTKAENEKGEAVTALNVHKASQATALVDAALAAGKITADKKESFVKLATSDFDQAKTILDSLPAKETFSDKTKQGKNGTTPDREGWNYMRYLKEAPAELSAMERDEPEKFAALKAEYKRG
jgi:phage head maturation protease